MTRTNPPSLIGQSQAFRETVQLIQRIAKTQAPVLIEGETGTGKELAARAIHYGGTRRDRPFIPVNCGAIPEALVENELFGHKRGAFTDARSDWVGLLQMAHGGTLFLDEVDALSPKAQVALLRFLQDQKFRPLGSGVEYTSDVRLLAASNRNLGKLTEEGAFRIDLLYRLKVLYLVLPPLRERDGDVPLLAGHFASECGVRYGMACRRFAPDSEVALESHTWPGNVRELENFVHREFLLTDGDLITITDPRAHMAGASKGSANAQSYRAAKADAISRFDRGYLLRLMTQTHGNVTVAAAQACKERRALGKLLKKYGIEPQGFRGA